MTAAPRIPAYVINLDASADRMDRLTPQFAQAGLSFTRVPAVDGRGLDLNAMPDCDPQAALRLYGRPLKGGEYGCYKSHLACAQQMLDDGHEIALVFEDDVTLPAAFGDSISRVVSALEQSGLDWRLVNLGAGVTRIYTTVEQVTPDHTLVAAHYFPQGAFGLLWHRRGAEAFVMRHAKVSMTVDNLFRHIMVRGGGGFAVVPPLVHHAEGTSVIDAGQKNSRYAERRWNYGLLKQKRFWVNRIIALYRKLTFRFPPR
jgi:glycosyl transferase family 25